MIDFIGYIDSVDYMDKKPLVIEFELQGLPKMMNGSHGHWRAAAAMRKQWREKSCLMSKQLRPENPFKKAKLTLTRCSSSCPDSDGLVAGFKPIIDGLKDAGIIIDDKFSSIGMPEFKWEKASPMRGKVIIRIEEVF